MDKDFSIETSLRQIYVDLLDFLDRNSNCSQVNFILLEINVGDETTIKPRKAECAKCGGLRWCEVRGHYQVSDSDEHMQWWDDWRILQCRGCDYIFVQRIMCDTENYHHTSDGAGGWGMELDETVKYWPALAKRKRPEWMSEFGIDAPNVGKLDQALIELYGALDNDLNILAGIRIRTAFDVASELLGINTEQSFQKKLDEIVEKGHIGIADKSRLATLVDAGSASAHRGWKPAASDLVLMTEILEHFVHDTFVAPSRKARLDAKATEMKSKVPPRKPVKTEKKD
ncbi:DUF4145 domain-containing protein [Methylobacterium hispanicum]|uniref:DUF4145 domain-containing protein n=1 Tax=Methylobacterium TaxID=407 RepID=UPI0018D2110F|nr:MULTISPECIES: DUF4145 domain-containing protein [Methylobacterium]